MKKIIKSKEDTKEVKSKYNELEEKRATVRKIRERFHSYIRKCNSTIEEGRGLSESMQEYATSLLSQNKTDLLGKCLFEVSQYQKFMEDATTDLCSYSLKNLDAQLETFIAREADNAQSIKKRYDKSRASLDSIQKSEVEDSEQHSRVVEIADEAIEQLKQVDNAIDLHTLGFARRYLQAIHVSSLSLSQRCSHSLLVLQSFSSSLFEDEVDQYEVETGRPFSTFTGVFSPPWATDNNNNNNNYNNNNDTKKSLSSSLSLFETRKRDISDLLKKERVYVDTLKSLVKIYLFEFRNNRQVTKVVSLQDLEDLFSNVEEILELHHDFTWLLQSALDPPFLTSLADLLLQFVPKLEIYVKYIANSSKSADTLSRLLKDKRCVTTAIKHCSEKDSSGKTFIDLLQMPLVHIKQYKLFIEQILERTPTSSDDYDPLDDALSLVFQLDAKISIANSIASQYQVLVVMSKRVEGGEELVTSNPSRKFIKESPASTLESDVTLLLFSDLLLVCTQTDNNGFVVKRRVGLSNVINAVVAGGSTVQIEISQEPPLAFSLPSYFEAQKWVDDLKSALQNLFTTKVFGVPLVELMSKHDREKENDIPSFIAEALDTIDATGIEMEGIFRVSGSVLTIRGIKEAINQGIPVDYRSLDIHSVAGMVQTWIRELPEPLLTYGLYTEWIGHTAKGLESGPLRATVAKLPHSHRFMLQHLCQFLNRVASFGKVNKMRSGNLAIVFGPSLLCERNSTAAGEQPVQLEKDGPLVQVLSFASVHLRDVYQVVQFLIENYKEVFEGVEEEREKYRAKIRMEKISNQQSGGVSRTEERKAIKEKRMNEERAKAEIAAASDPEAVKRAEEKRQAKREERERVMKEEKERQEQERKRQEEEEKAQIELVKKQRAEAEEQKRLERQKKDIEDIEKKFAESQVIMQQEEERAREQRRQRTQHEKDRQAKEEEEFKAREVARAQERKEREKQEAIAKAEEEEQQRKQKEREQEEARKKEEALPSCAVCGKKVRDGVVSKERGVAWHKECYKCVECNSSINGGGVTVNSNNTLVCANCVQKKKGQTSGDGCPSCGKPLTGRVVKVGDKRIHKACFKCDQCSGSLEDGYYEVKGKIVCENCAK